ncbi:MAG: hypothetical protein Wins2KO_29270 [Winogradskyella sp.]|uniref:carboxypeptidase-like regulatory domain-containing protein n=1 Tax=Winogradskyella sp. TaxID=1883156 RepID=UPI0025CDC5B7|nr:carboxypeptidase-like regulatory domain-containing protein [Winogradskyella sp.]NRB60029.1 carboxypeptidase-like regulatory domain-containing protein [Winogradskyella sp.]
MKHTLLFFYCLFTVTIFAQEVDRITVNGRISVSNNEKEGVAVYNTSSNKGTVTDENGEFKIEVIKNDIIEFSSLQFQDFKVTITEDVLKSKQLTVILVEEVNKLDEVVLLPFGLTGNINADLQNVRTYNVSLDDVYYGLDHLEDFDFSADFNTRVNENIAFNDNNRRVDNMLNVVNLAGFIVNQVVDIDHSDDSEATEKIKKTPFKEALDKYSYNYIHVNFDIPLNEVEAFIEYIEKEGVEEALLDKDKEMQLLERITQLSKTYLNKKSEED